MNPTPSAPRLAIIIPVYGHPVLVSEALQSALAQDADFGIQIIVVNDGCPHPETHQVLQAFALAYPERLTYLRKPNGGLSSARNAGIRHVLAHLQSVEALFMLDADNRLRPRAMAHAMGQLEAHPEAGWVYPSIDMFGIMARCDYGGPYSRLIHTQMNTCEAGSLIRRAVFEAGVLFDENFRLGFEDWDFFLSAGDAGFRGVNLEDFGFLYRKRPESMLANANRSQEFLVRQIREAHPALYSPANQLQMEHDEAPRYAIWLTDRALVRLVTDPDLAGPTLSISDYVRLYWASRTAPMQHRIPPYLVATTESTLHALGQQAVLHWLLWQLETVAPEPESLTFAEIVEAATPGHIHVQPVSEAEENADSVFQSPRERAQLWLLGHQALFGILQRGDESAAIPTAPGLTVQLDGPQLPRANLETVLETMATALWAAAGEARWRWRQPSIGLRNREHYVLRKAVDGQPVLPRCAGHGREIGIILSGTDAVPDRFATLMRELQDLRQDGGRLHLILLDTHADRQRLAIAGCAYDSLSLLGAPWPEGPDAEVLLFEELPLPIADPVLDDRALGLMLALNEVHVLAEVQRAPAASRLMGALRRWGTRTILHLPEASASEPGVALTLAYEHAYDHILAPDERLWTELRARGLPLAKIGLRTAQSPSAESTV
ncbi:glycosyltransferase family A protein [Pararhodobacter sp. CCB-MM2]|uniref:glycosyltransferase family 2 protein n=1 Tax=Pararhodobacter sp. CCB-MM2 TaxID=1786003 RepID=UPI00082D38F3|nr:glycosyltransferase family A protein [Pararhodobacter sp. CCB-MM2]